MLLWIDAVYDRTQADVKRVSELSAKGFQNMTEAEQVEWLNGMKGALNYADIKRIENNVQLLSDVLELDLRTCYGKTVTLNEAYFKQLLANVEAIRKAYMIHSDTPKTPSAPVNTYQKLNDIEKILYDVYTILNSNFFYYAGEGLYTGQDTALLL